MPTLIYGTAWKKERTQDLVRQAIIAGFRAVDTAAQPKHYREDLVGAGIADAMKQCGVQRSELYIQSKYTSFYGQDRSNMPYDGSSSISEQVQASIASSLRHFAPTADKPGEAYLDCLVMHSPFPSESQTVEAWRAMEAHVPKSVRTLGISNIYDLPTLEALFDSATVKPKVVQNRFYRDTGYDADVRAFCEANGITYQSFWTLTANPDLLRSEPVKHVAHNVGVSNAVALYGLVASLGNISTLDGTTNATRMKADLIGVDAVQAWLKSDAEEAIKTQKRLWLCLTEQVHAT